MLDDVKEIFRAQINRMFFGDNIITCVSESALDFSDPTNIETTVTVIDNDGTKRVWKIVEVKES